jgi:hypothetical protein
MIVRGLEHVGFDPSLFSGISARRGGLSTAIEKGVPEHILWMQSGHAQDAAARRYVRLGSPALLYDTWAAFGLYPTPTALSGAPNGWPVRAGPGSGPAGPAAGRPPHGASARPGQPGGT